MADQALVEYCSRLLEVRVPDSPMPEVSRDDDDVVKMIKSSLGSCARYGVHPYSSRCVDILMFTA